jgi:hypothetical protein
MKMMSKSFSSREDAEKWIAERFGNPLGSPAANQSYQNQLGVRGDHPIDPQYTPAPKPTFKPGTAITEIGIYVDESGVLWHVDPVDGNIDLIIPDDDV